MQKITNIVKITIMSLAKKSALIEANTTCAFVNYQPKESQQIKKLRKF